LFYNSSAKNTIIDPKILKQCIDFTKLFIKHTTSKSGIMLTNAKDKKINKKGETLQQRIAGNYQLRDGLIYSNSIEVKREIYLHRIN
ncbi:MAG: hypothetical protein N6V49_10935, partial [Serratia symbiotica]|nr:hypothetical protein [Serratia symbiotica]